MVLRTPFFPAATQDGPYDLEREVLRAMLPPSEVVAEGIAVRGDVGSALAPTAPTIILVTLSVDGLGDYQTSASDRMDAVLTRLLVVAPDVLFLQEVTVAMYAVVRRRLAEWKVYRKHDAD